MVSVELQATVGPLSIFCVTNEHGRKDGRITDRTETKWSENFKFCWPCILVWSLKITNLTHKFSCMFISILYMFQAAMCTSSGELLYQCDTWFMSLCVDDRLVCRSICSCIPDGIILVNNQLEAQFFVYVYFYSLHVSGSHVPIIRRIMSLCRWPSGMQKHMFLHTRWHYSCK